MSVGFNVSIDPKQVDEAVRAILDSALGEQLREAIAKEVKSAMGDSWNESAIREAVSEKLSGKTLETIVGHAVDALLKKVCDG